MFEKNQSWVVVPLVALVLLVSGLIAAPTGYAVGSYAAPEPVVHNRCGTSQDDLTIGPYFNHPTYGFGGYHINGAPDNAEPKTYPMGGAGTVAVTADFDSGSWTYVFDDVPCPPQAADTLVVVSQRCDSLADVWVLNEPYTNVADASSLARLKVTVKTVRLVDGDTGAPELLGDVADGQSVAIQPGGTGLLPGTWKSTAYSNGSVVATNTFFLPACGDEVPPPGDPGLSGGHSAAKPKGSIKQLSGHRLRVKAINKGVATKTAFRLKIGPAAPNKFVTLKPGQNSHKEISARANTLYKLLAKIQQKNGKRTWTVVARLRLAA